MFGFLRPGCDASRGRRYRQVYAACCAHQRGNYGALATLFNSYEAIFLYHLAIESGVCGAPDASTPTCCRFRSDVGNRWNVDPSVVRFCTAFAMLLAATKVEDDVRDSGSVLSRLADYTLRNRFSRARAELEEMSPGLGGTLADCVGAHLEMERRGDSIEMEHYVKPTAVAFESVFAAFAARFRLDENLGIGEIGRSLGAAIIAADCVADFERDRKRGEFNPLRSASERGAAIMLAQRELSSAGWRCLEIETDHDSITAWLLRNAFQRVGRKVEVKPRNSQSRLSVFSFGRRSAAARRGDCDCDCDPECIGGLCCEGGDGGGLADGGGCCCFDNSNGSHCHCNLCGCCEPGPICCDGCYCDTPRRKQKQPHEETHPEGALEGQIAEAIGSISPYGVVRVASVNLPARSAKPVHHGGISRVIATTPFGVDVESA